VVHNIFPFIDEDRAFRCPTFIFGSDDSGLEEKLDNFPSCELGKKGGEWAEVGLTFIG